MTEKTSSRGLLRWLTFGILILLIAGLIGFARTTQGVDDSFRMFVTNLSILASLILFALWFLCFGGWSWWMRLLIVFAGATLFVGGQIILFTYVVEVRGVTGDWMPNFAWKWTPKSDARLPDQPPVEKPKVAPPATSDVPDFPKFLGPNGDAHLTGVNLDPDWANHPPRELWRKPVGAGWSAFAVAKERAVTQEQRGKYELVTCYNLRDGALLWSHRDEARFSEFQGGDGPRATPTIVGDKVFTMGATGLLNCLDLKTGEPLWPTLNVLDDNDQAGKVPMWAKSCSPLVFDQETADGVLQRVVVTLGEVKGDGVSNLAAYDGNTGKRVWAAGTDRPTYATPVLTTLAGTRQIVCVNQNTVTGHDPATGVVLWTYDWPQPMAKCSQPVIGGDDTIFLSMGYHVGGQLLQVKKQDNGVWDVHQLWANNLIMRTTFSNVVVHKGYVYGLDDGVLQCLELKTGAKKWRTGQYRYGQVLGVDDLLLVQAENGKVHLVAASPDKHQEFGQLDGVNNTENNKTWNNPVLVGKYLLIRNSEEAVCYELPLQDGK